jgi:hypothetical protein
MISSRYTRTDDGLEYNGKGYLKSPKPSDGVWGLCCLLLTFAVPTAVLVNKWASPLSPKFFENITLFQIVTARELLTANQAANSVFLLGCLTFLIIGGVPIFFRKFTGKYTIKNPPPAPLRKLWPRQIRILITFGTCGLFIPIFAVYATQWAEIVTPKSVFIVLICVSLGIYFLTDGLISGLLFCYFYLRYWRFSD